MQVPREGAPIQEIPDTESIPKLTHNQCIGVSRGGRSTKIHAVVDGLGNPLYVFLTSGEIYDSTAAETVLEKIDITGSTILADKAYGTKKLREYISARGASYCIPPKSNACEPWSVDWYLYKERALVENFFLKIKEFRRVAMRFDKLALAYLAFVHLACIRVLLK